MKPNKEKVNKEIDRLRNFINENDDLSDKGVIQRRIAYSLETVLRWTLEETESWDLPLEECLSESEILASELRLQ